MTYEQIITDLKNKIYKPIYFLQGDEPYYIDQITDYILNNVLLPAERDFNQAVVYGKDVNGATIVNHAKRFPMMSNYQVVVVKEAQTCKDLETSLTHYVSNPLKSTILVINYKYDKLDGRKQLGKIIEKTGVLFESKKLYESDVPVWITTYLSKQKYSISPHASQLLSDFLGNDLSRIVNELDKLMLTLPLNFREITPDHIEKNIGISKEYNVFELNKALSAKDILKANRIINHFSKSPKENPLVVVISQLFSHFSKLLSYHAIPDKKNNKEVAAALKINPFFLNDYRAAAKNFSYSKTVNIISIIREYDMKSKGVDDSSTSDYGLMKEIVYKILH